MWVENHILTGGIYIEFREVLIGDIEQVAKLHNELTFFIQAETKDEYWDFETLTTQGISEHLKGFVNNQERKIFIAKDNEIVTGFIVGEIIGCHLPISSIKKVGYISGAYVKKEYRGRAL